MSDTDKVTLTPEEKPSKPKTKKDPMEVYLQTVIPTKDDFVAVGLAINTSEVPAIGDWMAQLKEVHEDDPKQLNPERVQVAVQRVMVVVAQAISKRQPDKADSVARICTGLIPQLTNKLTDRD